MTSIPDVFIEIEGPMTLLIEDASVGARSRFVAHPDLVELATVRLTRDMPSVRIPEGAVARIYPNEWLARFVVLGIHGRPGTAELDRWADDGGRAALPDAPAMPATGSGSAAPAATGPVSSR